MKRASGKKVRLQYDSFFLISFFELRFHDKASSLKLELKLEP